MASVSMSDELVARCGEAGLPVVLFNRGMEGDMLSSVTSDNVLGGQIAGQALLAGGHRRIAHIAGWRNSSTGRDRAEGFLQALEAAGQTALWVEDGLYSRDAAARITRARCADPVQRPDAIFVGNDHMAFAVMDVLRSELGLDLPGDMSIIGFDDVPLAGWPAYDLTTLRQPLHRMVVALVRALMEQLQQGADPQRTVLKPEFVRRGSARLPEEWRPDYAGL